jgi:hypothetical protein
MINKINKINTERQRLMNSTQNDLATTTNGNIRFQFCGCWLHNHIILYTTFTLFQFQLLIKFKKHIYNNKADSIFQMMVVMFMTMLFK